MNEDQVWGIFDKWLDKNRFRRGVWLKPTRDDVDHPYRPDFVVMAKGRKRRKIAIETKGSKFDLSRLLGQLLLYYACYSEVWAVLPLENAKKLVKIKDLVQRKKTLTFEIFGVTTDAIYKYEAQKFVNIYNNAERRCNKLKKFLTSSDLKKEK